jgi:hypothetical protein
MNTGDARNIDAIGTITTVTSVTTRLARVVERGGSRGARELIGTAGDSGDSGDRERQRAGAEKRCRTCEERKAVLPSRVTTARGTAAAPNVAIACSPVGTLACWTAARRNRAGCGGAPMSGSPPSMTRGGCSGMRWSCAGQ